MPRKATPAPVSKAPPINEKVIAEEVAATNQLATLTRANREYGQGRDLVNQLLGQAQAFQASANLLQTFGVSKLAIVKENKLYQQLKGMTGPNGLEFSGTWEEFCGLLGMSDEKANQDIANLNAFGEAALEQMQRVGIGYRDLRNFRRLPPDQKTELIAAAKAGDTDTLLELVEDLTAKHAKETASLQKDLAAKDQRIARHATKIQEFEDAADKLAATPLEQRVADLAAKATGLVRGQLRAGFVELAEADSSNGGDSRQVMAGYLAQMQQIINEMREEFMLPDPVGDGTPAWQKWAAAQGEGEATPA